MRLSRLETLGLNPESALAFQERSYDRPAHANSVESRGVYIEYEAGNDVWGYVVQDAKHQHSVNMRVVSLDTHGVVRVEITANGSLAASGFRALQRGPMFTIKDSNVFGWQ